jgi:cobalamin biosynthesis protein CobT
MPLFNKYKKRMLNLKHTSAACKMALDIFNNFWTEEDFDGPPPKPNNEEGEGDETQQTSDQDGDGNDGASDGSEGEDQKRSTPDDGSSNANDGVGNQERDSQEEETSQNQEPKEQQGESKADTSKQGNDNEEELGLNPFKQNEAGDAADIIKKIADLHEEHTKVPEITKEDGTTQSLIYNPHPVYDHDNADFKYGNLTKAMIVARYSHTGNIMVKGIDGTPIYDENAHPQFELYDEAHKRLENEWLKNLNQADRQSITSLARRLQAREKILTERGKKRGRLDSSRLYGVVAGDHNVFYSRTQTQAYSTAVAVYADASGSVRNVRMSNALAALNEALGMGNIPTEIATWKCGHAVGHNGDSHGNRDGCQILRIKQFKDNYKNVRGDLLMQRELIYGGTFAVEAYWRGVQSLLQRNEQRKVMFFLMDGHAAGDVNGNSSWSAMRFSRKMAAHLGVETIGIGVGFDMSNYIRGSLLTSFNDLAADMLQAVSKYFDEQGDYEAA